VSLGVHHHFSVADHLGVGRYQVGHDVGLGMGGESALGRNWELTGFFQAYLRRLLAGSRLRVAFRFLSGLRFRREIAERTGRTLLDRNRLATGEAAALGLFTSRSVGAGIARGRGGPSPLAGTGVVQLR